MTVLSVARRVSSFDGIERAGDYYMTTVIWPDKGGEVPEVFLLLPVHKGAGKFDRPTEGSGLHGVTQPPWVFRECPDGSLEIRPSIACGRPNEYWHGYLDEGNIWRQL